MNRGSKVDVTALVAMIGIAAGTHCNAASAEKTRKANANPLLVAEQKATKKGTDSACGKGSCGVDQKGAASAKQLHSKKTTSKETKSKTTTQTKSVK